MRNLTFLAHGATGPLDEIVALISLVIFLGLMGASLITSWLQSKKINRIKETENIFIASDQETKLD